MPPASLASGLWPQLAPIVLLVCSNLFMTIAWYGHLKFKSKEPLSLTQSAGFALIALGAALVFRGQA